MSEPSTPRERSPEWVSTSVSPVDSPVHPRRRKNRQRRSKARKQRQLAESAARLQEKGESAEQQRRDMEERKSPKDMSVDWFYPEVEEGNVEYKLKIKDPNSVRFQQLVTQMKFRLSEGNGVCYYCLGVADDGYPRGLLPEELQQSIDGVFQMAELLHAKAEIKWRFVGGYQRHCAVIQVVRQLTERLTAPGIRIGVIGSMDVGKSTLIACLTNGDDGEPILDDGQGSARTNILKHKHEIETGHTSTVTKHFLGYQKDGEVLNYSGLSTMTPAEIGLAASQRVNLIDMGGHEKFLKTVFRGLTAMLPDYVIVCVSSLEGVTEICIQQVVVALALNVPLIFALTKMEMASNEMMDMALKEINELYRSINASVRSPGLSKSANDEYLEEIANEEDVTSVATRLSTTVIAWQGNVYRAPFLRMSTVSGAGIRLLHALLNALESRISTRSLDTSNKAASYFQIDEILELTHAGNILSGTLISGMVKVGQQLCLGSNSDGEFDSVRIKTLRCNQVPVQAISSGQTATISVTVSQPLSDTEEQTSEGPVSSHDDDEETKPSIIKSIRRELREASLNCGVMCEPTNPSALEGTVLLDKGIDTTAHGSFEAILCLMGGQWPPRGLISGKWPPHMQHDSESDSQSGGSFNDLNGARLRSCSPHRSKKKHQGCYTVEVYCGGIRQSATITSMEELDESDQEMHNVPAFIKAASAIASRMGEDAAGGCIARIRFQFQNRPEWLRTGFVLIIRDQTQGLLSGVGVISNLP